jgi:hypothetical protein
MTKMRTRLLAVLASLALTVLLVSPAGAQANRGVRINVANPEAPFPPDKAAEAFVAIDAHLPNVVAAGAFDETDEAPCGTPAAVTPGFSPCNFAPGVGTSGVYFSFDSGEHWIQPSFTGLTAASGTVQTGTIHTLPWYAEAGLVSDADSAGAFGPRPINGHFSWSNGSRFYYANLTSNLNGAKSDQTLKGFEGVGVSRIDNPTSAAVVSNKNNWMSPVLVPAHVSRTTFEDKEQIWADNASSSRFFGHVYVCFADYRGQEKARLPQSLSVATSTDGGSTWAEKQLTSTEDSPKSAQGFGRSGCTVRTDSDGVVYVFADQFGPGTPGTGYHIVITSNDGGKSWSRPRRLFSVNDACYHFDPVEGRCVGDGNVGGRIDLTSSPSVDIANGAPSGSDATNEMVDSWVDGRFGLDDERVLFSYSTDAGRSWSSPQTVPGPGRGFYSAPAIAPDGSRVYVSNSWFLTPFQETTANPRMLLNTLETSAIGPDGAPTGWTTAVHGVAGDARAGSSNGLAFEFLGDYNYAAAARTYGVGVWTADARDALDCPAIDDWRQSLFTDSPLPQPNPATDCPGAFGNINMYAGSTG